MTSESEDESTLTPKPSNISLNASLRPSQSEIPISFMTLGGGNVDLSLPGVSLCMMSLSMTSMKSDYR